MDDVAAIATAMGPRWRAMVVTLAGSGLRIGELRALQVADVDFLRRTISVTKQRTQGDELAAHPAAYPSSGPLFTDEVGAPVGYGRWKNLVAAAVIALPTYSHLWPGDEDRTRNVLDAALSPLADSLRTPWGLRRRRST